MLRTPCLFMFIRYKVRPFQGCIARPQRTLRRNVWATEFVPWGVAHLASSQFQEESKNLKICHEFVNWSCRSLDLHHFFLMPTNSRWWQIAVLSRSLALISRWKIRRLTLDAPRRVRSRRWPNQGTPMDPAWGEKIPEFRSLMGHWWVTEVVDCSMQY